VGYSYFRCRRAILNLILGFRYAHKPFALAADLDELGFGRVKDLFGFTPEEFPVGK